MTRREQPDEPTGNVIPAGGYLVVEGPIGVGKTTLVGRLAERLGCKALFETPEHNPFLPKFYEDPGRFALPTQLSFLIQRSRQLRDLRQGDLFESRWISDYFLPKDALFAELNLDPDEYNLYQDVFNRVAPTVPAPSLVVFLSAPVEILLERIARRGVDYEKEMKRDYLDRLVKAYQQFFARYDAAPLLRVDTELYNFADNDDHFELLVTALKKDTNSRHLLNPI